MTWIDRAEAALTSGAEEDSDVRVLRGERPQILDAEGVKGLLAPFLAAIVWAAAIFREMVAGTSLDPLAMFLRLLALGLTLRVFLLGAMLVRRLRVWSKAHRFALVLAPEGLLYRSPEVDVAIPRSDVVGVAERGRWQDRGGPRRYRPVYLVTDPRSGRSHLALPPLFDGSPGRLAERLMRWRGAPPDRATTHPTSTGVASQVWDEAVRRASPPDVTVIRHGREWLTQAPYAALLVGVTAAEGLLRAGPAAWAAIDPAIGGGLVLAFLLIPARWLWVNRREVAPRQGVALVLTPAELLIRTYKGMLRAPYGTIATVTASSKRAWSFLEGAHEARQLVITRTSAPAIRYDEPYLGVPVEVAQLLVEAHRDGRLPGDDGARSVARDEEK